MFTDVDPECLAIVAQHLSVPNIYSLVLVSKAQFFGNYFEVHGGVPLAATLLQDAMQRSLERRLRLFECMKRGPAYRPISLKLSELFPEGVDDENPTQVILAGSIVVQAALETTWIDSDIDIFCTWEAAPRVRQRIIDHCFLMCSGACDTYSSPSVSELNTIDHVEGYAARPSDTHLSGGWHEQTYDEYYAQALAHGQEATEDDSPNVMGSRWGLKPKRVGLPNGSAGAQFPYNYDRERHTFVQLVVGKEASHDARDMLSSFDLSLCKVNFDGKRFRLAGSPEDLFRGRSWCLEPRRTLIQDYISSEMTCEAESEDGTYLLSDVIAGMTQWPLVGFTTYDPAVVEARQKVWWHKYRAAISAGLPLPDDSDPSDDPTWALRHEFMQKLLVRMQKYAKRGIQIINPPFFALYYQTTFNFLGDYTNGPSPLPLPLPDAADSDAEQSNEEDVDNSGGSM